MGVWLAVSLVLTQGHRQRQLFAPSIPWLLRAGKQSKFLMNVYYEERLGDDIDEIRRELNIELPPKEICWK